MQNRTKDQESRMVYERIKAMASELRDMSLQYGVMFRIQTYLSDNKLRKGQVASESEIICKDIKYRHDHFFGGNESFTNRHKTAKPEDMGLQISYHGCDGKCFECIYPDCMKAAASS